MEVPKEGGIMGVGVGGVGGNAGGVLAADLVPSSGLGWGKGAVDGVGWECGSVTETCSKLVLMSPGLMSGDGCSSDAGANSSDSSPVLAVATVKTRRCRWVSSKVSPRKCGLKEKRYTSKTGSRRPLKVVVVNDGNGKINRKLKFDEGSGMVVKAREECDKGEGGLFIEGKNKGDGLREVLSTESGTDSNIESGGGCLDVGSEKLAEEVKVYDNYCRSTFWIQKTYGFTFEQYLAATGEIVGHSNVLYFNGDDRTRVEITVSEPQMVDVIVKQGLLIQGAWFKAYRKVDRPVMVALSGVPPVIPDVVVCKALEGIGDCAPSDCRAVYAPCENSALKHVRSHRRRVWVKPRGGRPRGGVVLPEVLDIPYGGQVFTVNVSSGVPKCFGCGKMGHVRSSCRESGDGKGSRGGRVVEDKVYEVKSSGGGGGLGNKFSGGAVGSGSRDRITNDSLSDKETVVGKMYVVPPLGGKRRMVDVKNPKVVNDVEITADNTVVSSSTGGVVAEEADVVPPVVERKRLADIKRPKLANKVEVVMNSTGVVATPDVPVTMEVDEEEVTKDVGSENREVASIVEDDFARFKLIMKGNEEWRHDDEDVPQCSKEELLAVCELVEEVRAAMDSTGKIPQKIMDDLEIETLDRVLNCKDDDGLFKKGGKYYDIFKIIGDVAVWQIRDEKYDEVFDAYYVYGKGRLLDGGDVDDDFVDEQSDGQTDVGNRDECNGVGVKGGVTQCVSPALNQ